MLKKIMYLCIGVILLAIITVYGWDELRWHSLSKKENVEPYNKNMQLIGNDRGFYYFGNACSDSDGSLYLASALTDRNNLKEYAVIQKLDSKLNLLWERKTRLDKFAPKDILPSILRKDPSQLSFDIRQVTVFKDKLFAMSMKNLETEHIPFILEFDLNGKLLNKYDIDLHLEKNAYPSTLISKGFGYICYLNHKDKMLCLSRIDLTNGKITDTSMKFWNKLKPDYNRFAISADDSTAFIALDDYSQKNSSFLTSKKSMVTEHFRTASGIQIKDVELLGDKIYGVVKEDSLLQIVDLTNPQIPLVIITDSTSYGSYQICGIARQDDNFYLALNVAGSFANTSQQDDIIVIKYAPDASPEMFVIGGRKFDLATRIMTTADKKIIVLGTSFSHKPSVGLRNFVSRVSFSSDK